MATNEFKNKFIAVTDLLLDVHNPRFEDQENQRAALRNLAIEQNQKLVRIAEHIARNGLNPSEMPIVLKAGTRGQYTVLEGNRRIAAIKLGADPGLANSLNLQQSLTRSFKSLYDSYGTSLPETIMCAVAPSREKAKMWIELRHTGENQGIGIINWNGIAAARFRGESPETQFLEIVKDSVYLDTETREKLPKISITNIQRLLGTPEARAVLGVKVSNKQLVFVDPNDKADAIGRLAIVVSDIVHKYVKVTQLDSKGQRVNYAEAVAARDLPSPRAKISATSFTGEPSKGSSVKVRPRKTVSPGRGKGLIPRSLKLNIAQPRVAKIYQELQKLTIDGFENSCAVLLRVVLEMSLVEYCKKHRISLVDHKKSHKPELTLKQKAKAVADYLEEQGICDKHELYGIRSLANTKNTVFSITTWHAYVHNPHYTPTEKELIANWDNIQTFFAKLWE